MLPLGLLLAAVAVPAAAFAFPAHSTARTVLAMGIFYWTLLLSGLAWMAWVNYSLYTRIDGPILRTVGVGGRRALDLRRLQRMRSFSMWGQFGGAHTLRLHTDDGQQAMVVASMPLAGLNRKNLQRERDLRAALREHADVADERARWWLGAGPRPPRLASARHVMAMLLLYALGVVALLVVLVAYLAAALY